MSGHAILIGLSGSGKSTVAGLVSAALQRPLYDTDALLAERGGAPVPELLRTDAARFRRLEEEVVASLVDVPPGVVATGGGVVVSPRNRASLRDGNLVIWLRAPVRTLAARLATGEERPLLAGDIFARLSALEGERMALYAECAHHILDTAERDAVAIAHDIAVLWHEWEAAHE